MAEEASGRLILKNLASGDSPRVAPTSSCAGSAAAKALRAAITRNGAATKVWASTMPARLSVSRPPKSRPTEVYGPTKASSRTPLTSGGRASGSCTTRPTPRPGGPGARQHVGQGHAEHGDDGGRDGGGHEGHQRGVPQPGHAEPLFAGRHQVDDEERHRQGQVQSEQAAQQDQRRRAPAGDHR